MILGFGILALAALIFLGILLQQRSASTPPPQTPKKIGVLQWVTVVDPSFEGFKKAMSDLGYMEGRDVVYEYQNANADPKKAAELARNFVDQGVDLMYAMTFPGAKPALDATIAAGRQDIPIVFAHASNPVEGGIIESYRSSGNNLTGVAADIAGLTPKKLEILKRINPKLTKVGVFVVPDDKTPSRGLTMVSLRENARQFGITLVEYPIRSVPSPEFAAEVQRVADSINPGDVEAMFHPPGVIDSRETQQIDAELGNRLGIPVTFVTPQTLALGGLFVYSHDFFAVGEQAAVFADKIFQGARPADIPIEVPQKNVLTVSTRNAQQLGIIIPPDLLEIAERWD